MGNTLLGNMVEVDKLSFDAKRVTIYWTDGHRSIYDAVWLRDNCPADRDARSGQRLVDIAELPEHPAIGAVSQSSNAALLVTWRGEPTSRSLWVTNKPLILTKVSIWQRDDCN